MQLLLPDGHNPLRGVFLHLLFTFVFQMNIALQFRPVQIRLYVAYMADAVNNGFKPCDPGNTWTRMRDTFVDSANTGIETIHPYGLMWNHILSFYDKRRMYEMSDVEIIEMWNNARANGIDDVDGMSIMRAKQRWDSNGWMRYEHKRNGRRTVARVAVVPLLACFGLALPVDA